MAFLILVSQGILSVQGRAGARDYHLKGQFVPKISDKRDKLAKEWINLGKFVIKFDKIDIYFADIFRRQPPSLASALLQGTHFSKLLFNEKVQLYRKGWVVLSTTSPAVLCLYCVLKCM